MRKQLEKIFKGEGPTISTTLPTRRGTRWRGGRRRRGRSAKTLASICLALSSPSIQLLSDMDCIAATEMEWKE
ncbi:hypothetical protein CKAN_01433900 [Cinnamomum micranthum f. kanehirae]|uniref:Uncharacterized protein n=1 Tax=Cinnamomum micranthum f. kanehirae TaxID=337451 RepID=A0A3S3QI91_9MAGN|nr:hypothetical protein CKAN_01433900 [Cinnamomum micranthum f. kanehirae]